jgi:hypothetical protein
MNTQETVKKVFNACNPRTPANDNNYIDCRKSRGGEILAGKVKKQLYNLESGYLRFLFAGHIGSGKSSELLHLADLLKNSDEKEKFFPVYVDIRNYVKLENVTFDEILLAIAVELTDIFDKELNIKLENNYFKEKLGNIKDFFTSSRKFSNLELNVFGFAKTEIQRLRENDEAKRLLFEAITNDNKSLLDELNIFIAKAKKELIDSDNSFTKLIIIVDTLEKIQRFEKAERGIASQKELFIERSEELTGIEAHTIYTIPLPLYRSGESPNLLQKYVNVLVLPMVKIFHRGKFDKKYEEGCISLREILTKRFGEITLDQVFDKDALEFLIKYSGGNLRNLMMFIQESVLSADNLPVSYKIARKSIQQSVRSYASSVDERYWDKLADLETSAKQQIDNGSPDFWIMLENLTVMEYVNGDETDSLDDTWYAVNPVIRETIKFQSALERKSQIK